MRAERESLSHDQLQPSLPQYGSSMVLLEDGTGEYSQKPSNLSKVNQLWIDTKAPALYRTPSGLGYNPSMDVRVLIVLSDDGYRVWALTPASPVRSWLKVYRSKLGLTVEEQ